jgi:hypothetical protein
MYLFLAAFFFFILALFRPPGSGSAFGLRIRIQAPIECGSKWIRIRNTDLKYSILSYLPTQFYSMIRYLACISTVPRTWAKWAGSFALIEVTVTFYYFGSLMLETGSESRFETSFLKNMSCTLTGIESNKGTFYNSARVNRHTGTG